MRLIDKITYMINTLELTVEEIEYAKGYLREENKSRDLLEFHNEHRCPNMTLIRENLKTIQRLFGIIAKEIPVDYQKI